MTNLLTKAFRKASDLPEHLQDELAKYLLEEIEWEMKWDKSIADSHSKLSKLANKALRDFSEGKTKEMGFDNN